MIEFRDVYFEYNNEAGVLRGVSFSINAGESIGIVGCNGAGKTTLIKLMLGLETGFRGEITINGLPVTKANLKEIRRMTGYVMQDSDNQLFMSNVYEDICFGPENYGYSKDEVNRRAEKAMELTGTEYIKNKPAYKLSYGEKKLAAIASILSMEPEIMIMDEPEASLDPLNRNRLKNVINSLPGTKLIVSHDLDFIWETADRVILIGNGEIKAFGNTKDVLTDETLLNENSLILPYNAIISRM